MNSTQIHTNLDRKEVRDFLSREMAKTYISENRFTNNEYSSIDKYSSIDISINNCNLIIKRQIKYIKKLQTQKAILQLIHSQYWDEFDVSDFVSKDNEIDQYWNFIGTEEEYCEFIEQFNGK